MPDGARNALLGYLFQLYSVAALRACALVPGDVGAAWLSLLVRVAKGKLTGELFNQDALVLAEGNGPSECAAIQVKYTGDSDDRINLQDLVELLHGFEQSRQAAAAGGWVLDRYFLLTNRVPDSHVAGLFEGRSEEALGQAIRHRIAQTKEPPEWLRRALKAYPNSETAQMAWARVLARLDRLFAPFQSGLDRLTEFARQHGVLPDEMESALSRLVGRLVQETAAPTPLSITAPWLRRHLTGVGDARDLRFAAPDGILTASREHLGNRLTSIAGPTAFALTTRPQLARALRDQFERFPVVFVHGGGGTGKSVLAVQHLLGLRTGPVGLSLRAADATESFLLSEIRRLRSRNHAHLLPAESLDRTIARFRVANDGRSVVLACDLEGLDESDPGTKGELCQLIRRWFHAGPGLGAKLIVSCRPRATSPDVEHSLLSEWLGSEYPDFDRGRVGFVEVRDFDADELEEANRLLGSEVDVPPTGLPTVSRLRTTGPFQTESGGAVRSASQLGDSLLHPAVWGAYASLPTDDRHRATTGDATGLGLLAKRFVSRFLTKCSARCNHMETHLLAALRAVATHTASSPPPHARVPAWDTWCRGPLNDSEAAVLYREAVTYGLIQEDEPSRWRWRHRFVADWLTREGVV